MSTDQTSNRDRDQNHDPYEVGYGRPPKSSQFKKGQSGNPRGRPKQPSNLAEALKVELKKEMTVQVEGRPVTMTGHQALAKKLMTEAFSSDPIKSRNALARIVQTGVAGHIRLDAQQSAQPTPLRPELVALLAEGGGSLNQAGQEATPDGDDADRAMGDINGGDGQ